MTLPSSPRFAPGPRWQALFRAVTRVAALLLVLVGVGGCKGWRVESVEPAQLIREQRPEIVRLDLVSDSAQVLWAPSVAGDSVVGLPTEKAINPVAVALGDIRAIATRHFSLGKSALLGLAIAGGVALYEGIQSLNQSSY